MSFQHRFLGAAVCLTTLLSAACGFEAGTDALEYDDVATAAQPLWIPPGFETWLWTENNNVVPMCWDEFIDERDWPIKVLPDSEINALKIFVANTIEQGWARPTQLKVTWVNCPTSGTARHVRVKLRVVNGGPHGFTGTLGMATLTGPADRGPGKDAVGFRVAVPRYWRDDSGTIGILLHEFGHILGFGHEQNRSDGDPSLDPCYEGQAIAGGIELGELDPESIMGFSYCTGSSGVLSPEDIKAARSQYGTANTQFAEPRVFSEAFCAAGQVCRLGDVDADGLDDLVAFAHAGASDSYVWVGRSLGDGFAAAQRWSTAFCAGFQSCEVADVDGDRRADLIAFSRGSQPSVWVSLAQTNSTFGPAQVWGAACRNGEVCKLADVTGDGRKDVVVFTHNTSASQVWVSRSTGRGFVAPELWSSYFCLPTETCDVGDVNGDRVADIVAFKRDPNPQVWVATSSGRWFNGNQLASNYFCPNPAEVCSVADVNGDGRADLVSFTHDENAQVWVGRGLRDRVAFASPELWLSAFCALHQTCLVGNVGGVGAGADAVAFDNGHPTNQVWAATSE